MHTLILSVFVHVCMCVSSCLALATGLVASLQVQALVLLSRHMQVRRAAGQHEPAHHDSHIHTHTHMSTAGELDRHMMSTTMAAYGAAPKETVFEKKRKVPPMLRPPCFAPRCVTHSPPCFPLCLLPPTTYHLATFRITGESPAASGRQCSSSKGPARLWRHWRGVQGWYDAATRPYESRVLARVLTAVFCCCFLLLPLLLLLLLCLHGQSLCCRC